VVIFTQVAQETSLEGKGVDHAFHRLLQFAN
jgi:hypothetical protein